MDAWERNEAEEVVARNTSRKAIVNFVYRRLRGNDLEYWLDVFGVETRSQLVGAFVDFARKGA